MPVAKLPSKLAALLHEDDQDPVVSAVAARKLELLKRVRVLRESALINKGKVENPKPNKIYVWVNTREERRTFFEGLGYQICRDPDIKTRWKRDDGTHQRGDLVLYECDKELYEAIKLDSELRALEAIEGPQQAFEAFAERESVPLHYPKV